MTTLKRLLLGILMLVVFVYGLVFYRHNTDPVIVDLVFIQLPASGLAVWLVIALALGLVAGILGSSALILRLRAKNMMLQRKLKQ